MFHVSNLNNSEFTFIELIAEGQIGAVYKVQDKLGIVYALKSIKPYILENDPRNNLPELKAGIEREAWLLSNFQHKNVVQLIKTTHHNYLGFCMILEYLPNGNLRKKINEKSLSKTKALEIFDEILELVKFFHTPSEKFPLGMVHLDLEPKNILFNEKERFKLCDFHFSRKVTEEIDERDFPTPRHPIDKTTDIQQLGKLLYEILTFKESCEIDLSLLPDEFKTFVNKLINNNLCKRCQSIEEVIKDFDNIQHKNRNSGTN